MADFGDYCFWKDNPDIAIDMANLPLLPETVENLKQWLDYFENNVNIKTLKFNSDIEETIFNIRGEELCKQVQLELKEQYKVNYYRALEN